MDLYKSIFIIVKVTNKTYDLLKYIFNNIIYSNYHVLIIENIKDNNINNFVNNKCNYNFIKNINELNNIINPNDLIVDLINYNNYNFIYYNFLIDLNLNFINNKINSLTIKNIIDCRLFYRQIIDNNYDIVYNNINDFQNNIFQEKKTVNYKNYHLLLATFERNDNLLLVLNNLLDQTYINKIQIHLLDNNIDEIMNNEIDQILVKFKNTLNINLIRKNKNIHCLGRFYVLKEIYNNYPCDYFFIIDDDQIYDNNWIENMIHIQKPLIVSSWYGKNFNIKNENNKNVNFFKSNITFEQIRLNKRKEVNNYEYFGPGGCIIDSNLLLLNEIFNYKYYNEELYKFDDIWISYCFKYFLNINFVRSFNPPIKFLKQNELNQTTWYNNKTLKNEIFNIMIEKFNYLNNSYESKFNINKYFNCIYVLNLKQDENKYNYIHNLFKKYNIKYKFIEAINGKSNEECIKIYNNYKKITINSKNIHEFQKRFWNEKENKFNRLLLRNEGTIGIMKTMKLLFMDAVSNNYDNILVFQDDVIFDNIINFKIKDFLTRNKDLKWNILNLGSSQHNWENFKDNDFNMDKKYYKSRKNTFGAFASSYKKEIFSQLINRLDNININYDNLIAYEFTKKFYTIYPNICIANLDNSKTGMNSRNIKEYSKKFKWDLNNFT